MRKEETMTQVARIKIPARVRKGEAFRVRTKVSHPMETGWRKDGHGEVVPRNRIHSFACTFNGQPVFRSDFHSEVSADPYLSFFARIEESGTLEFIWIDDAGTKLRRTAEIEAV